MERVRRLVCQGAQAPRSHSVERLVWAVQVVSQFIPQCTCLVQALAVQSLLARQGTNSRLVIGVALEQQATFQAHAWVEHEGIIIIGETAGTQYKQLLSLDSPL